MALLWLSAKTSPGCCYGAFCTRTSTLKEHSVYYKGSGIVSTLEILTLRVNGGSHPARACCGHLAWRSCIASPAGSETQRGDRHCSLKSNLPFCFSVTSFSYLNFSLALARSLYLSVFLSSPSILVHTKERGRRQKSERKKQRKECVVQVKFVLALSHTHTP